MQFVGFKVPFEIDSTGGIAKAYLNENLDTLIKSSILTILGYKIGERLLNRNFGTPYLIFEHLDTQQELLLMKNLIIEALIKYENRILIKEVNLKKENSILIIEINYIILLNNKEGNVIIKFGL